MFKEEYYFQDIKLVDVMILPRLQMVLPTSHLFPWKFVLYCRPNLGLHSPCRLPN